MATYGTDLTTLTDAESGTWVELNSPYNAGGTPAADGENYIQGQDCQSQTTGSKSGLLFSILYDAGSDISSSFTTDDVVLLWQFYAVGINIETFANGGLRVAIASDLDNANAYKVGGRDFARNPYGGWMNVAVDPTKAADYTIGSGNGGAWRYFGSMPYTINAIAKGTPHAVDAIRYGRGEIYCTGTGCTFDGIATYNDYNDATNGYNRFGLFQAQPGGFLWKGLLSIGQSGTSATFSDSNKAIVIDDCPATYSTFNRIAIRNAGSSVTWSNVSFQSLGTTSPGELAVVENATVSFDGCSFQNMSTFTFLSNSTITNCIFKSCKAVDAGGGVFTGTAIRTSAVAADASAMTWNDSNDPDGYLDDMEFSKGTNDHHAITFGTGSPTSITLRGWVTSGFSSSNGQNSSTFYVARTSGTVIISVVGGSGNFTYKSAGATVIVVVDPVTTTITCKDAISKSAIQGVAVTVRAAGSGPFPYNLSVTSLTQSGGTATAVCASAHGLATGQKVEIKGASPNAYNRIKTVTVTAADTFTYPIDSGTSSPATGTITCTAVFIDAETNASGVASDTRVFSSDQAVEGWAAKGTSSPLYVRAEISETIDSTNGLSLTVLMQSDE